MTILQKASDSDGFIYEVIQVILSNMPPMSVKKLQFMLVSSGVYVKKPLLDEILKTMKEKKLLAEPTPKPKIELPKIIHP